MSKTRGNPKKASLGYTIGNYCIRGIGFLTLPIFSRLLSTADFGLYNTFASYEGILFIIIGIALHTSFKNAFLKYKDGFRDYIADCVGLCVANGIIFLIGTLVVSLVIPSLSVQYAVLMTAGSFSTAIIAYYNAYLSIYYQSGSYIKIAGINAVGNVVLSFILILTVFQNERGMGRIYGKTLPIVFISVYLIHRLWKTNKPCFRKEYLRFAVYYSLPLVPHGLSQVLLSSSDRIMISKMIGNAEAGVYSFAFTLSSIVGVTYSSLEQVFSPWFYEAFQSKRFGDIRRNANSYLFSMSLLTIIVMLVCPEATLLIGSARYEGAIALAVPVMLGGYFSFLYSFAAVVEYYHEKTRYIAMGTLFAAVVNVILNFLCISHWGYTAAAYTTLFTYFLYFVFHCMIAGRIMGGRKLYNIRFFAVVIVAVNLCGIITQILIPYPFPRWIMALVFGLIFLVYAEKTFGIKEFLNAKLNGKV